MNMSESALREHLDDAVDAVERRVESWQDDLITVDSVPAATPSTAKEFAYLAKTAALLGATRQSREWFGAAARFRQESIRGYRLRRDISARVDWRNEPPMFSRAIDAALLSRDEELVAEAASGAVEMEECYVEAFADDYRVYLAQYYNAKVKGALAVDDERAPQLLAELERGVARLDDKSVFWETIPEYYRALIDGDQSAAQAAVSELFDHKAGQNPDPDDPKQFVLDAVCAYVVLARRHGIEVSIDSERLPPALLREEIPADDVTLDVDVSDLQFTSDIGFFELEREDDGSPVIAGRIYHPGGEPVRAADVPERDAGRVLSDEWVEAALAEASWRDHYDDDLVADARAASEAGELRRKLVVVQDRTDQHLFEESLTELPIDDVQLLKGAGKLD